jgi:hypothetical protein
MRTLPGPKPTVLLLWNRESIIQVSETSFARITIISERAVSLLGNRESVIQVSEPSFARFTGLWNREIEVINCKTE